MVGGVSAKLGINLTVHFIWNKSTEKLLYQFGQTWSCKLHFTTKTSGSGYSRDLVKLTYLGIIFIFWLVMLMSWVTFGSFCGNWVILPVLHRTCEIFLLRFSPWCLVWSFSTWISDKQRHCFGHRPSLSLPPYKPRLSRSPTSSTRESNLEISSSTFSSITPPSSGTSSPPLSLPPVVARCSRKTKRRQVLIFLIVRQSSSVFVCKFQ